MIQSIFLYCEPSFATFTINVHQTVFAEALKTMTQSEPTRMTATLSTHLGIVSI